MENGRDSFQTTQRRLWLGYASGTGTGETKVIILDSGVPIDLTLRCQAENT